MTIILFILVLLVCVIAHEAGHFFAAKKSGMLVEEFGFGIPPRLASWKKGETTYSINALPIGGFVKIAGENGLETNVPKERQFDYKPWYLKSIVLVAGVVCNVLLAFVLFTISYTVGLPGVTPDGTPTVVSVVSGSPTEKAGIQTGDTVLTVTVSGEQVDVLSTEKIKDAIARTTGSVGIEYEHDHTLHTATITPMSTADGRLIGIAIEPIGVIKQSLPTAIKNAAQQSVALIANIFGAIGTLVGRVVGGHPSTAGLIGPVGLAKEVGNAATFGFAYLLAFIATISLNLAVLNIMPFPALDGGRLLVVWVEALTRKKLSPMVTGIIHATGFLILIGLMVILTIGDIRKAL